MSATRPLHALLAAATTLAALGTSALGRPAAAQVGPAAAPVTCGNYSADKMDRLKTAKTAIDNFAKAAIVKPEARRAMYEGARDAAIKGIGEDAANPFYYLMAARAQLALGDPAAGDTLLKRAAALCPALGGEADEMRERGWTRMFDEGIARYRRGDTTGAISTWEAANRFYDRRPDTYFNIAVAKNQRGDRAGAVAAYREALATFPRMAAPRSEEERGTQLESRRNVLDGLSNVGGQYYSQQQFAEALGVYEVMTAADSTSRDAWYNRALTLYKLQRWPELAPVARKVVAIDPLNYNARVILFNAYKAMAEAAKQRKDAAAEKENYDLAVATITAADSLPVDLGELRVATAGGKTTLRGTATGRAPTPAAPFRVEFTFYDLGKVLGTQTVTITPPAKGASAPVEAVLDNPETATSFSYRRVP